MKLINKIGIQVVIMLLLSSNSFTQADTTKVKERKNTFYIDVSLKYFNVKLIEFNSAKNLHMPGISLDAGGQFYFGNPTKKGKVGLDVEFFKFTWNYLLTSTFSVNIGNVGIVYTHRLKKKKSGFDFKILGGVKYGRYRNDFKWGAPTILDSFGWALTSKVEYWIKLFKVGFTYNYSQYFSTEFFYSHGGGISFGIRL